MEKLIRRISGVEVDEYGNPVPKRIVKRDVWPHHMDFILSCVGYAVGFGSIWRFPYLCMRNGGGAFLIPYIFFMVVCGVPLFFMELALGQYAAASPLSLWNICPLFKGLGWSMIIVSGLVCIYYNIILTWVFYYLVNSFGSDVPWRTCRNWWNTDNCNHIFDNTTDDFLNISSYPEINNTSPAEEYWKFNTLGISNGIENLGGLRLPLVLCLIFAWVVVFACLCKGVKSVGKVVYFTATSPYVFLFILLIRNCMLEGSWRGIRFYITPRWERLADFSIWAEAALQVFFSLGPAWGGLITLSSFNKFRNNCYRDAIIIPVINCFTSLFGGFVIFAVIGYMANISGKEVKDVMEVGPGVVFIAYPEAIAQMPLPSLWAILFFLMLVTIGLDSQFGMFETVVSSFVDEFAIYLRPHKIHFTAFMCLFQFLLALPLVTRGGIYVFTLMDWYCGTFSLALIAFLEVFVVCYIYGWRRFREDIESMTGHKPGHFWTVLWVGITPAVLIIIFGASIFLYKSPTYGNYQFPAAAIIFGWFLGFVSLIPIPLTAINSIYHTEGTLKERITLLLKPSASWGEAKEQAELAEQEAVFQHQEILLSESRERDMSKIGIVMTAEQSTL